MKSISALTAPRSGARVLNWYLVLNGTYFYRMAWAWYG